MVEYWNTVAAHRLNRPFARARITALCWAGQIETSAPTASGLRTLIFAESDGSFFRLREVSSLDDQLHPGPGSRLFRDDRVVATINVMVPGQSHDVSAYQINPPAQCNLALLLIESRGALATDSPLAFKRRSQAGKVSQPPQLVFWKQRASSVNPTPRSAHEVPEARAGIFP